MSIEERAYWGGLIIGFIFGYGAAALRRFIKDEQAKGGF